jgi:hypothetical protein
VMSMQPREARVRFFEFDPPKRTLPNGDAV